MFFLGFGISNLVKEQENLFGIRAAEFVNKFEISWEEYETSSRWLFQACGTHPISHLDFHNLYDYFLYGPEVKVSPR